MLCACAKDHNELSSSLVSYHILATWKYLHNLILQMEKLRSKDVMKDILKSH